MPLFPFGSALSGMFGGLGTSGGGQANILAHMAQAANQPEALAQLQQRQQQMGQAPLPAMGEAPLPAMGQGPLQEVMGQGPLQEVPGTPAYGRMPPMPPVGFGGFGGNMALMQFIQQMLHGRGGYGMPYGGSPGGWQGGMYGQPGTPPGPIYRR